MARRKAKTKFAATRVDNEMDRFIRKHAKFLGVKRSELVLRALNLLRREAEIVASAVERGQRAQVVAEAACSCAPDDRAKDGCRCEAGVGR